ncbi:MAG: transposase, partial [Armatimonadota bacterium]
GKRYSEEQIVRILGEIEGGRRVAAIGPECGVTEGTIYRWRKKFGGMDLSEVRRLKELEAENARLRRIGAQRSIYEGRPVDFPHTFTDEHWTELRERLRD